MFSSKTLALLGLLVPFTLAQYGPAPASSPTPTPAAAAAAASSSSSATTSNTKTQTVTAAVGGATDLNFTPNTITAAIGTFVEFHFGSLNHSLAQSSFASPCTPANSSSFFAGFNFATAAGTTNANVFTIEINDTTPIWFYCPQVSPAPHCPLGMVGAINAPATGNTFDNYLAKAKLANGTTVPATIQGGIMSAASGTSGSSPSSSSSGSAASSSPTGAASHLTVGMGFMGLVGIAFSALLSF